MKRLLYAIRLWAWFVCRDAATEPFEWFKHAYDQRQGKFDISPD